MFNYYFSLLTHIPPIINPSLGSFPLSMPRALVHAQRTNHQLLAGPIARPNEPELLINGRPLAPASDPKPRFKEGAQVKLDCVSSGGRPAPRIEWLNVSGLTGLQDDGESGWQADRRRLEVQLMRAHWPQKKSTFVESMSGNSGASGGTGAAAAAASAIGNTQVSAPITSSSVTISVTRHDLHSHFVCIVLPTAHLSIGQQQQQHQPQTTQSLEQLIKNPAYLAALLSASRPLTTQQQQPLMFKLVKLDVQG